MLPMLAELEGSMWRLNNILSPKQEHDGFAAFEDEDFIYIKRFDEVCLTFSSSGTTMGSIQEAVESIQTAGIETHL